MGGLPVNSSMSGGNWSAMSETPLTFSIPAFLYIVLLDVLAVSGNTALVIAIVRSQKLRSSLTYLFVLNLCVIDLLASFLLLPAAAFGVYGDQSSFPDALCQASGFMGTFCTLSSILAVCAISVERFYVIKLPMEYAVEMTFERAMLVLSYVWIQSILLAVFPTVGWNSYEFQSSVGLCNFTSTAVQGVHKLYVVVVFFFGFVMPGLVMLFMYYGIYKVAQTVAVRVQPLPASLVSTVVSLQSPIPSTYMSGGEPPDIVPSQVQHCSSSRRPGQPRSKSATHRSQQQVSFCSQEDVSFWCRSEVGDSVRDLSPITDGPGTGQVARGRLRDTTVLFSKATATVMASVSGVASATTRAVVTATATATATITATASSSTLTSPTTSSANAEDIMPELSVGSVAAFTTSPSSGQRSGSSNLGPVGPPGCPSKAAKTLVLIMLTYMALWGPYFLVILYCVARDGGGEVASRTLTVVTWLAYTSFAINPVMYGWLNRTVREEVVDGLRAHMHACIGAGDQEDPAEAHGPSEDFYEFLERTSTRQSYTRRSPTRTSTTYTQEESPSRPGY